MLTARGVSVKSGGVQILQGASLTVAAGEWVNIIGPNGAGKTTLLKALLGLVSYEGDIEFGDVLSDVQASYPSKLSTASKSLRSLKSLRSRKPIDTSKPPLSQAEIIAYVPQNPVIPAHISTVDYVLLGRVAHRGIFSAATSTDHQIVDEVLERLDLQRFVAREMRSLSGGEKQRAVIARALVQQARILLLDEPVAALDLGHQQDILELLDNLRRERGLTVIVTLHDLTLAACYGDKVALLSKGNLVEAGTASKVITEKNVATFFSANVTVVETSKGSKGLMVLPYRDDSVYRV